MSLGKTLAVINAVSNLWDFSQGIMKPYATNGCRHGGTDSPKDRNKKKIKRAMAKESRKKNRK